MFGLLERDKEYMTKALKEFHEIDKAIIFGSRAMGNYKKGSDIDLALVGQDITLQTVLRVTEKLNEVYPIPYFFDIIHYETIQSEALKEHIDQKGIVFYMRE